MASSICTLSQSVFKISPGGKHPINIWIEGCFIYR